MPFILSIFSSVPKVVSRKVASTSSGDYCAICLVSFLRADQYYYKFIAAGSWNELLQLITVLHSRKQVI